MSSTETSNTLGLSAFPQCVFEPLRKQQKNCTEPATVFYGEKGYCLRHSTTIQALKTKEIFEASQPPQDKKVVPKENIKEPDIPPKKQEPSVEEKLPETPLKTKQQDPPVSPPPVPKEVPKVENPPPLLAEASESQKKVRSEQASQHPLQSKAPLQKKEPPKKEQSQLEFKPRKKLTLYENDWGRYEDEKTGIVFDPHYKAAFGTQDHNTGKVLPLSNQDIEFLKRNGLSYIVKKDLESTKEKKLERTEEEEDTDEEYESEEDEEEDMEEEEEDEEDMEEEEEEEMEEEEEIEDDVEEGSE